MVVVAVRLVMMMMVPALRMTAEGHGMLLDPPQRSSLWRDDRFPDAPVNNQDSGLFCGGFYVSISTDINYSPCFSVLFRLTLSSLSRTVAKLDEYMYSSCTSSAITSSWLESVIDCCMAREACVMTKNITKRLYERCCFFLNRRKETAVKDKTNKRRKKKTLHLFPARLHRIADRFGISYDVVMTLVS